jgi:hypothetical protein
VVPGPGSMTPRPARRYAPGRRFARPASQTRISTAHQCRKTHPDHALGESVSRQRRM